MKYALLAAAALALIVVGVAAYVAATFDPRQYESRIVDLVKAKTGRTLTISGKIELSFWPDIGVKLGRLSLSERTSADVFADVEGARLTLKGRPLLSGEFVAGELHVRGAHVRIVRGADGRLNIDDLLGREGGPVRFDIGRVAVERSALTYRDLASGARYELSDVAFESGRLTNGVLTTVALGLTARDAEERFEIAAHLKARLLFDLEQQVYRVEQGTLQLKGHVPGVSDLVAEIRGAATVEGKISEVRATQLSLTASGRRGEDAIETKLDLPSLIVTPHQAEGERVALAVSAKGPAGTTSAQLALPHLKRDADILTSEAMLLELALQAEDAISLITARVAGALRKTTSHHGD